MLTTCTLFAQNTAASYTSRTTTRPVSDSIKIAGPHEVVGEERVYLDWTVENNQNADKFEVERSIDGKKFVMAALVFGTGKEGTDRYWFFEKKNETKASYRIKIIHTDGTISYSGVSISKPKDVNE